MIRLTFPYDALCPDNQKMGLMRGRLLLTSKYRTAKIRMNLLATIQYRGKILEGELELDATLYTPTARVTDPANFAKITHDALEGVVYANDAQIRKSSYIRGGVDRLNPRLDVVVREVEAREAA